MLSELFLPHTLTHSALFSQNFISKTESFFNNDIGNGRREFGKVHRLRAWMVVKFFDFEVASSERAVCLNWL